MRPGLKSFKEFSSKMDWKAYINKHMANTLEKDGISQITIVTGRGETVAVWQKHGYGYIEECRSPERLKTNSHS